MTEASNNKRIAKNAVALYFRMLLTTIVSLYTSRVVLNTLGVEDFGIYGVVGGVVAMLGFLNAAMSGATSRFLTFELGKGDSERLRDTFNSAMIIHVGLALIVFIVAETIGLWFMNTQLVIPENRMYAANWVYQFSILSAMIGITQVPYNASIIAHEKMDVYAYVEILNVVLKLVIVYLLVLGDFDKLILYGFLTLCVSITIAMVYRGYCSRNFSESHLRWVWNKEILKPMLSFSGWDLYGNMCVTARQQGTNILLNIFFGPVVNAASSIAGTVNGATIGFANNIITAFRPQIIINYAHQQWDTFVKLILNALQLSSFLLLAISIPILTDIHFILQLWLGQIPLHAPIFIRIILMSNILGVMNSIINIGIHATGKVKYLSIVSGSFYLFTLPIIYIAFKYNMPAWSAYLIQGIIMFVILVSNILILHKQIRAINIQLIIKTIMKIFLVWSIALIPAFFIYQNMQQSLWRFIFICFITFITLCSATFIILLDKTQRIKLLQKIRLHQ